MLKKSNRISKKREFEELKSGGKLLSFSPFFGGVFLDKKDDELKFGVVISKKISKRAVDRNKIKRMLMEVLSKKLGKFEKGLRVLFLIKKAALKASIEDIESDVNKLISKME